MERNLNRRDFLGLMVGGIAASMLPSRSGWGIAPKKPNFILIFADDLGEATTGWTLAARTA